MTDAIRGLAAHQGTSETVERTDRGASMGQDSFLRLLMAQMQHQDPSSPTDSAQMMTQLAQFSSVESLTKLNKQLAGLGASQEFSGAVALLGKTVTYEGAEGATRTGTVAGVETGRDGPVLRVGTDRLATSQVREVR